MKLIAGEGLDAAKDAEEVAGEEVDHPVKCPADESVDHPVKRPADDKVDHPVKLPADEVDHPVKRPADEEVCFCQMILKRSQYNRLTFTMRLSL
jgi:hypothetical protein